VTLKPPRAQQGHDEIRAPLAACSSSWAANLDAGRPEPSIVMVRAQPSKPSEQGEDDGLLVTLITPRPWRSAGLLTKGGRLLDLGYWALGGLSPISQIAPPRYRDRGSSCRKPWSPPVTVMFEQAGLSPGVSPRDRDMTKLRCIRSCRIDCHLDQSALEPFLTSRRCKVRRSDRTLVKRIRLDSGSSTQ